MEFNEKLQELRKRKGLTQEELAEFLFVSRTAVSKWESGVAMPSTETLLTIAEEFEIPLDYFLRADHAPAEKKPKEQKSKKGADAP